MLMQLSVTNYRSIKDTLTLSLNCSADSTHERVLISANDKTKLLPVTAIYGANAAGKSNILRGFQTMQDMVTGKSAQLMKEAKLPYDPFRFINESPGPTDFDIIFFFEGIKYEYGFSYNEREILAEYLYHWPNGREALVFSREGNTFKFMENISEQKTLSMRTPENKLYLVTSSTWNSPQTDSAFRWFSRMLIPYDEQELPVATSAMLKEPLNNPVRERILKELAIADLGIADVGISDNDKSDIPTILMTHKTEDASGKPSRFAMDYDNESRGTQRFYSRIGPWLKALEQGGILLVDEIESSLHPLLTKRLVEMVQDPDINQKRAQLVFTTHDVMLLDLNLLRRDQIWFVEKGPKSLATETYSLWDYSVRKDENILKGYLHGRYGAIPFIGGGE